MYDRATGDENGGPSDNKHKEHRANVQDVSELDDGEVRTLRKTDAIAPVVVVYRGCCKVFAASLHEAVQESHGICGFTFDGIREPSFSSAHRARAPMDVPATVTADV